MNEKNLVNEIRNGLVVLSDGRSISLKELPNAFKAYVVRFGSDVGVCIPCTLNEPFYASFAKVELKYLPEVSINGEIQSVLWLYMNKKDISENVVKEFGYICLNFVDPGENGVEREKLVKDPLKWWKAWKVIIGNKNSEKMIHGLIGELMVYHYLLSNGLHYKWTAADRERLDFVGNSESIEVKTTTQRNGENITVHGVFQLMLCDKEPLKLIFVRLEENQQGESINDMLDILEQDGCDRVYLENVMQRLGFIEGSSERNIAYKVLEAREYLVDSAFPSITPEKFVGGIIPAGISNLEYMVDLANLNYSVVNLI